MRIPSRPYRPASAALQSSGTPSVHGSGHISLSSASVAISSAAILAWGTSGERIWLEDTDASPKESTARAMGPAGGSVSRFGALCQYTAPPIAHRRTPAAVKRSDRLWDCLPATSTKPTGVKADVVFNGLPIFGMVARMAAGIGVVYVVSVLVNRHLVAIASEASPQTDEACAAEA